MILGATPVEKSAIAAFSDKKFMLSTKKNSIAMRTRIVSI
jgi:hypothetical protein